MALRVATSRLHMKTIGNGPSILRVNNSFSRMKHFDGQSPLAKHVKKGPSTLRVIGTGLAIGVVIGTTYAFFSKSERKLPGVIVNTPTQVPMLDMLPPNLKVTRKVCYNLSFT